MHAFSHLIRPFPLIAFLFLASGLHVDLQAQSVEVEFFERMVRPILVEHCYECHSGRSEKTQAGLRVDHRSLLLQGGDSGSSILPGQPDQSLLIQAVQYESFEMPPRGKLPQESIDILRKWVEQGAFWPEEPVPELGKKAEAFDLAKRKAEHWMWSRNLHPQLPLLFDEQARHAIDLLVLAPIRERGWTQTVEADRPTIIRRIYLDLIGLPPNPEQLEREMMNTSFLWYEEMVDRLLASPQFGVRWGRHWLDLVRYAESRGHEFDEDIPNAFHFRDYVVRAFNADVPYDRFATEQIAGDLISSPRRHPMRGWNESVLGTGFWHLGEWVHSPVDTRKDETDRFDNMLDVFSKTFLGTTLACARCHDHKFDAIGSEDYYAMSGFLQSSHYRMVRFETDLIDLQVADQLRQLRAKKSDALKKLLVEWIDRGIREPALGESIVQSMQWMDGQPTATGSSSGAKVDDASQLSKSSAVPLPSNDPRVRVDFRTIQPTEFRTNGPAIIYSRSRDFQMVWKAGSPSNLILQPWSAATADSFWQPMKNVVDKTNLSNRYPQAQEAGRTLITPTFTLTSKKLSYLIRGGARAFAAMDSLRLIAGPLHGETLTDFAPDGSPAYRWVTHSLDRYAGKRTHVEFAPIDAHPLEVVQVIDGEPPQVPEESLATDIRSMEEKLTSARNYLINDKESDGDDPRFPFQSAEMVVRLSRMIGSLTTLAEHDSTSLARWNQWNSEWEDWKSSELALSKMARWESQVSLGMIDGSAENDHLLVRGNADHPGPSVDRRFLAALDCRPRSPLESGSGRLHLASELVDPGNPLTSRVIVNRLWHHLFGRGIVPTTDDFGVLGQRPSHPELLDYLASEMIRKQWSIKELIRAIVLSHTYRLSSSHSENYSEADPENIWLTRARVRRLEAEPIRDSILAISGRLDLQLEGQSIPVHLTDFLQGRGRPGNSGPAESQGRRSLYIAVRRNFLIPMMMTFDAPVPFSSMGRRNVSNVPAQSLMLLNDSLVHDLARSWSRNVIKHAAWSTEERIDQMYLAALGRRTLERERVQLVAFIESQRSIYPERPEFAYEQLAHILFNTKEFLFRF